MRFLGLMAMIAILAPAGALAQPAPTPAPAPAPAGVAGDWDGALHPGGVTLRLALHLKAGASGLSGTLDSIDQGINGLVLSHITTDASGLKFDVDPPGASFAGKVSSDGQSVDGAWSQRGQSLPLVFIRRGAGTPQASLVRPQEPKAPFPYQAQDVTFAGATASLAGTLTLPTGKGPFPAVVLISGSGPNDRDELVAGHRPFLVIADYLTRRRIAVLRYDKRGIGASQGDYRAATTLDFAADAAAAVAYLRTRPEIEAGHVGLIGHSEGGLIAPIVAAKDPRIGFVVLLAGPGVDGETILQLQGAAIARIAGADAATIARSRALNAKVFAAVKGAKDYKEAAARATAVLAADPIAAKAPMGAIADAVASDWFRFFLTYDPVPALRRLRGPVLVLAGSKDLQVPPAENLPPIRAALADDHEAVVEEIPGLNHLFQTARTGSPEEYAGIEETVAPAALARIAAWIADHDR